MMTMMRLLDWIGMNDDEPVSATARCGKKETKKSPNPKKTSSI